MPPTFDKFFAAAFEDGRVPYGYQCRFACGDDARGDFLLAYFEALFRAAEIRASIRAKETP